MKSLKICLVILCLLPVRAVGTPQFSGANFFMKEVKLYSGHVALVDDEDFEMVNKRKWHLDPYGKHIYAASNITSNDRQTKIKMHRLILGCVGRFEIVDHIDGNGLNNQKKQSKKVYSFRE